MHPEKQSTLKGWFNVKKRGRDDVEIEKSRKKALEVRRSSNAKKRTAAPKKQPVVKTKKQPVVVKTKKQPPPVKKKQPPVKTKKKQKQPVKKKSSKIDLSSSEGDDDDDDTGSLDAFVVDDDEDEDSMDSDASLTKKKTTPRKAAPQKRKPARGKKQKYSESEDDGDADSIIFWSTMRRRRTNCWKTRRKKITAIFVPLGVTVAICLFLYIFKKKKEADSLWLVKSEELHFRSPPFVIGPNAWLLKKENLDPRHASWINVFFLPNHKLGHETNEKQSKNNLVVFKQH